MNIYGTKNYVNDELVIKGKTEFGVFHAISAKKYSEIQTPSIFMNFEYKEPLPEIF